MSVADQQSDTGPANPQSTNRKIVNLALQGGGSHGAFTWGVLDRLLEESRLDFEGVTGTSAGAVNAVVLADGLAAGGREGAREALRVYWQKLSALSAGSPLAPSFIDKTNPSCGLEHSLGFVFLEALTYFASPYQMRIHSISIRSRTYLRRPSTSSGCASRRP
jgi:NTE family protein